MPYQCETWKSTLKLPLKINGKKIVLAFITSRAVRNWKRLKCKTSFILICTVFQLWWCPTTTCQEQKPSCLSVSPQTSNPSTVSPTNLAAIPDPSMARVSDERDLYCSKVVSPSERHRFPSVSVLLVRQTVHMRGQFHLNLLKGVVN